MSSCSQLHLTVFSFLISMENCIGSSAMDVGILILIYISSQALSVASVWPSCLFFILNLYHESLFSFSFPKRNIGPEAPQELPMHACPQTHAHTQGLSHTQTHTCTCATHTHACTHAPHTHTYTCMHSYATHPHMHTHAHMCYTYLHTHLHTCATYTPALTNACMCYTHTPAHMHAHI